jgi:hypothetical protein
VLRLYSLYVCPLDFTHRWVQEKIRQLYTELLNFVLGVPLLNLRFALGTCVLATLCYPLYGNMELHMFAIMIKALSTALFNH